MKFLVLFLTLIAQFAWADDTTGGGSDGGGSQIEAAFRAKSYELIGKVSEKASADAYCAAGVLQAALEATDIKSVSVIKDPKTNRPIEGNYDAWTTRGLIQLKTDSWERFFNNPDSVVNGRTISTLILHELYRATGTCDDDRFVISDKVIRILGEQDGEPGEFSKVYKFAYWNKGDFKGSEVNFNENAKGRILCDKEFAVGRPITCVFLEVWSGVDGTFYVFNFDGKSSSGNVTTVLYYRRLYRTFIDEFNNLLGMVTAQRPLLIVYDFKAVTTMYGFYLSALKAIPNVN